MTILYVYGIVDTATFDAGLIGHEGAAVFPIAYGNLAAAASTSVGAIAPLPENIWKHEQVLEALMRQHAVLPFRFGTFAQDDTRLCNQLRRRRAVLLTDLDRVRGKVEFALRIGNIAAPPASGLPPTGNVATPFASGADYLRARTALVHNRTASESAARTVEHTLRQQLDSFATEATWDVVSNGPASLTASYLVGRDAGTAFVEAVTQVRARHPALDVGCTGPWAPYSFVTATGAED